MRPSNSPDGERTATVMNSVIADTRFRPSTPLRILASNDSTACLVRKQKKYWLYQRFRYPRFLRHGIDFELHK